MATNTSKQPTPLRRVPVHEEPDTEFDDAAPPPKKKRSLTKILLLLTLLLAVAGGGGWYFLQGQDQSAQPPHKPGTKAAKHAKPKSDPSKPPIYVSLEPFTVNLQREDASAQYLQVGLSLKVSDDGMVDAIKLHMPEIRNRVLLLLSGKTASEISTVEGKKALSSELTHEIVAPLAGSVPANALDSVLFTSFVIQ